MWGSGMDDKRGRSAVRFGGPPVTNSRPRTRGIGVMLALALAVVAGRSFLLSTLADRREERLVHCLNNEKQIALATLAYAQDYDSTLPPHHNAVGTWPELMAPYLGEACRSLLQCPSAREGGCSYLYRNEPLQSEKLTQLESAESLVLGAEGSAQGLARRHDGGFIAWYADGHAKVVMRDTPNPPLVGLDQLGSPGRLP
jgi:prepilin-type processing-associated H-X9-DG protein